MDIILRRLHSHIYGLWSTIESTVILPREVEAGDIGSAN